MTIRLLVVSKPCHEPINRAVYRELASRPGIDVHIIAPRSVQSLTGPRVTEVGEHAPYRITCLDLLGSHGRLERFQGLDRIATDWKPTHVLVDSDPASLVAIQAASACPRARLWALTAENLPPRYLLECSDALKKWKPKRAVTPLVLWTLRGFIRRKIDRVFTLSASGNEVLTRMGFRSTQIPLGFDPLRFCMQSPEVVARTRARLGLHSPTVAYFGRLTREKGVDLLVAALSRLRELEWQFLIDSFAVYRTAYMVELDRAIRDAGLVSRVVYFDARHEDMPDYMNAADIVVLPSVSTSKWKEQYGRVIPEAMACGKIVVGSDSGAIPEVVGGHGHIVPEGNVEALAECLRGLLTGSSSRLPAETVATYALDYLSIYRQADIWESLLRE